MTDQNLKIKKDILKWVIIGLAGFAALVLVFGAGVKVGTIKARYSYRWAENYHKNFAGPQRGFFENFKRGFGDKEDFINAHGTFGSVIKIDGGVIIVKSQDNVEKTILVSDKTTIVSRRESLKTGDLKVDDQAVIIGSPNEQGQIEAKFIRVFK
ncbi:MAG: hypothetical protein HYW71_01490 [Candidatus Niyogibacteria bacterium]|nr:hypothetical protein [Candidatus Niyogibacteria bacterium]